MNVAYIIKPYKDEAWCCERQRHGKYAGHHAHTTNGNALQIKHLKYTTKGHYVRSSRAKPLVTIASLRSN